MGSRRRRSEEQVRCLEPLSVVGVQARALRGPQSQSWETRKGNSADSAFHLVPAPRLRVSNPALILPVATRIPVLSSLSQMPKLGLREVMKESAQEHVTGNWFHHLLLV